MSERGENERPMWSSTRLGLLFLVALVLYLGAIAIGAQLIRLHPTQEVELQPADGGWRLVEAPPWPVAHIAVLPADRPPRHFPIDEQGLIADPGGELAALLADDERLRIDAVSSQRISLAAYLARELGR